MARKSLVEREKLKIKLVSKFADKRAQLKEAQRTATTFEERMEAQESFKNYQGGPIQIELLGDVH